MKSFGKIALVLAVLALAGVVNAGTTVSGHITTDTTWTKAMSPIHMAGDVFVDAGASLTIEAGVVVASYVADMGSLAVSQGADIYVLGTQIEPVIMTSANDVATWDGSVVVTDGNGDVTEIVTMGDPKTGTWRPVCNEWGSLAIMGNGYISASQYGNADVEYYAGAGSVINQLCPSATNKKQMEGLVSEDPADESPILYGGDDDNDDSGVIRFLSLRYGGRDDIDVNKELNGLSLGAVGRATDISHVEVMNNKDDGIELWGGTVCLSYVNIWNIGDDSFDVDEGWRGCLCKALIVQGYCDEASQGSGVGDNAFETDGAEDAHAQPMTTALIKCVTVVGQPADQGVNGNGSDAGTAWRDNARVQYDSCIWMDLDDELIKFDCEDGDGANGYDGDGDKNTKDRSSACPDGTMNWDQHWTTSYNTWVTSQYADPNYFGIENCGINHGDLYGYVCCGYDRNAPLCQITNSVFYGDNIKYTEYNYIDALVGSNLVGNAVAAAMPIQGLTRGTATLVNGGYEMSPVTNIVPNPVAGVTAGAFDSCTNWLVGWSAAHAYGMTSGSADINCDGSVDMEDLATMSSQWLN